MTHDVFNELGWLAAMVILGPYVIAGPITILWLGLALLVRSLTGWKGLLPADVWQAGEP